MYNLYPYFLFMYNSSVSTRWKNYTTSRIQYQGSGRSTITPPWNKIGFGQFFDLTLYHGTDIKSALQIIKSEQFIPSKQGNLGPGIYFTDDKSIAQAIGKDRAKQRGIPGSVVIVCKVKCYEKYCRKAQHGKWVGVCDAFIEYCLQKEHGDIKIKNAEFDKEGSDTVRIALLKKVLEMMIIEQLVELMSNLETQQVQQN